jgi:hypothetical protein
VAVVSVTATWQAILRVRHPEFAGLIVEPVDDRVHVEHHPRRAEHDRGDAGATSRCVSARDGI